MDKTDLVKAVANLFELTGHRVQTSVKVNHREIDVVAEELNTLLRKTILIECADYSVPVGIDKLQTDLLKLRSAQEVMRDRAVIMHVSAIGYTPEASGYAQDQGISISTIDSLTVRLINFDQYVESVQSEPIRAIIQAEYQPTKIHFDGQPKEQTPAPQFLDSWLSSDRPWLTIIGDYGVGKSWALRMFLYRLIDRYKENPLTSPLPLFVPLQRFTKAFDFQNLILRTFQLHNLSGIHYSAFEYLAHRGRIVFLFDSFDEMAQSLSRETLRENLRELLDGARGCRSIMTSRPTYFESRAERLTLVERGGISEWHPLDRKDFEARTATSRALTQSLSTAQFARLNDLSAVQRKKLFGIVLGSNPAAHKQLNDLYLRFQELETISQRAVIARLLTTVAETLAMGAKVKTIEGYPLIPDELVHLNQAKIFEIVVYNLLLRDSNVGFLTASERLSFLRQFAVFLQRPEQEFFAEPDTIRGLVSSVFSSQLRRTDAPQQQLENYSRTCRRHSGLTTESQFNDTSGNIDSPVDEEDTDSKVGFSHNSLREYLAADALADFVRNGTDYPDLPDMVTTELIGDFFVGIAEYQSDLVDLLAEAYRTSSHPRIKQSLFKVISRFIAKDRGMVTRLLGDPPKFYLLDLSNFDLSGLDLRRAHFSSCEMFDTDLRKSDLRQSTFDGSLIFRVQLDDAMIQGANFVGSELESIYVLDRFDKRTSGVFSGKDARQWLFSNGALVSPTEDLNTLLGKPWYEAAREVTRTLERRMAGTHQDVSLVKGTQAEQREFARSFVDFLISKKILLKASKSKTGPGWVLKVSHAHRKMVSDFSQHGQIAPEIKPFFDHYLDKET